MTNAWSLLYDEITMAEHSNIITTMIDNDPNRPDPFKDSSRTF